MTGNCYMAGIHIDSAYYHVLIALQHSILLIWQGKKSVCCLSLMGLAFMQNWKLAILCYEMTTIAVQTDNYMPRAGKNECIHNVIEKAKILKTSFVIALKDHWNWIPQKLVYWGFILNSQEMNIKAATEEQR